MFHSSGFHLHNGFLFLLVFVTSSTSSDYSVVKGGSVILECSMETVPWQWCQWKNLKSNVKFSFTSDASSEAVNDRVHVQLKDHFCNLVISDVTLEDAGEWRCHLAVTSEIPLAVRADKTTQLSVVIVEESDVKFNTSQTLEIVEVGEEIEIHCGPQNPDVFPQPQMQLLAIDEDEEIVLEVTGTDISHVIGITEEFHGAKIVCLLSQEYGNFSHTLSQESDLIFVQIPVGLLGASNEEYVFRDRPIDVTISFQARPQPSWDQITISTFSEITQDVITSLKPNQSSWDLVASPLVEWSNGTNDHILIITILHLSESVILRVDVDTLESFEILVKYDPPTSYFATLSPSLVEKAEISWLSWILILLFMFILIIILACCLLLGYCLFKKGKRIPVPNSEDVTDLPDHAINNISKSPLLPIKDVDHYQISSEPTQTQSSSEFSVVSTMFSDSTLSPPETSSSESVPRVPRVPKRRPKSASLPSRPIKQDVFKRNSTLPPLPNPFSPSEEDRMKWALRFSGPTYSPIWIERNITDFQTFKPSPKLPSRRIQQFHCVPK